MKKPSIVPRDLTPDETEQMNRGFDQLHVEEGVELESSERISFVATQDEAFVGCATGLAFKNGGKYSGWFLITDLYVERDHRSQGIRAELLDALESQLKKLRLRHVFLWTSGEKALRFYRRQNYLPFAEMEGWYSDGSNRVGLRKDL